MKRSAQAHLALAQRHLEKVRAAWDEPTDRLGGSRDLRILLPGASRVGRGRPIWLKGRKIHRDRVLLANRLHKNKGLPDVSKLLADLHNAQKYVSYGDIRPPHLVAEDVARKIEEYVEAVVAIVE